MFKIYVGNISYQTPQRAVEKLFSTYCLVDEVIYVCDEKSGEPRGFAFVLMPDESQGRSAIAELDGRKVNGRPLAVSEAGQRRGKKGAVPAMAATSQRTVRRNIRGARASDSGARRPFRRNRGD